MKFLPQRKSPRLQGYDYSQSGAYFVTICTCQRMHLFGEMSGNEILLSTMGQIAYEEITRIPVYWSNCVELDLFVVMPNHLHIILVLVGTPFLASADLTDFTPDAHKADAHKRVPTLGMVIGSYKSGVTRRIRQALDDPELRIWQGRYHDHIIRNATSLERIREYVIYNPARWQSDTFYDA